MRWLWLLIDLEDMAQVPKGMFQIFLQSNIYFLYNSFFSLNMYNN
jgi:hypothetical protein